MLLILLKSDTQRRFGAFISAPLKRDENAFLFNFDTKQLYRVKDASKALTSLNPVLKFDKDLELDLNLLQGKSEAKRPTYNIPSEGKNALTGED